MTTDHAPTICKLVRKALLLRLTRQRYVSWSSWSVRSDGCPSTGANSFY
jgi:hypothetical protein